MALQRWDPFDDMLSLRDAMDRLLQESFVRPASSFFSAGRGSLPLDVSEDENSYIVHATMPGVKADDVQVNVHGDTLTIRGESRSEENQEHHNYIMHERRAVSFHRSVTLPGAVNADQAEAHYENGVLTLMLPKAEAAKPKQIKVHGSQGQIVGSGESRATDQGATSATSTSSTSSTTSQQTGSQATDQDSDQPIPMPPAHQASGGNADDVAGQASG